MSNLQLEGLKLVRTMNSHPFYLGENYISAQFYNDSKVTSTCIRHFNKGKKQQCDCVSDCNSLEDAYYPRYHL